MGSMEQVMADEAGARSSSSATWMVWVAGAAVVLSALALFGGILAHFLGYALASLLAFTLIALFRRRSVEISANAGVGVPRWINFTAVSVLIVGFLVAIAQSWVIASYFS
jgi:hypothetical protein